MTDVALAPEMRVAPAAVGLLPVEPALGLRPAEPASRSYRREAEVRWIPRVAVLFAVATFGYAIDVATKFLVVAVLGEDEPVRIGHTAVTLRVIRNPGAAFGLDLGSTALFTLISVVVIGAVLRAARRVGSLRWAVALGLLLGGSLGNLTDRLSRAPGPMRGRVVDFVELPGWPIFNLADALICVAGVMIVLLALRNVPLSGRRRRR
jgi:signal peptidase II